MTHRLTVPWSICLFSDTMAKDALEVAMSFEDQLKKIKKDLEVNEKSEKKRAIAAMAKPEGAKASTKDVDVTVVYVEEVLSDDELFARSIENIDSSELYRGKFGDPMDRWRPGQAEDVEKPGLTPEEEDEARRQVAELRELRTFEQVVGKLDRRFDDEKFYVPPRPRHEIKLAETPLHTEPLALDPVGLREVEATPAHRELLKRAKSYARNKRLPELHLRGDTREDAIQRLEAFIEIAVRRGDKFARVIHGKGKQSAQDPVIKPAVLTWCEGPGAQVISGYAPEVAPSGDYGSIIIEFRKASGPSSSM